MYRSSSKAVFNTWNKLINSANQQWSPDKKPVQPQVNTRETDIKPSRNQGVDVKITPAVPGNQGERTDKNFLDSSNLKEAIVWSEILGKPVCKRRKRRYYGD